MGYEKHNQKGDKNNYRNGHTNKTLKTSYGKTEIKIFNYQERLCIRLMLLKV